MGRPRKNNLEYFSHEADAWDNDRFAALRAHYGGETGYAMEARFWHLNCLIAKADNCRLDLNPTFKRPRVAENLGLSLAAFNDFITFLADIDACGLLHDDSGVLWTERTQANLDDLNKLREAGRDRKAEAKKKDIPEQESHKEVENSDSDKRKELLTETKAPPKQDNESIPAGEGNNGDDKKASPGRHYIALQDIKGQRSEAKETGSPNAPPASPPLPAALSIIAVEAKTTAAGYRIKPLDLRLVYDALTARQGTVECLVWILGQMRGKDVRTPAAYLIGCIEKWNYVAKWRESLLAPAAASAAASQPSMDALRAERESAGPDAERESVLKAARMNREHHVALTKVQCQALSDAGEELTGAERRTLGLPSLETPAAPPPAEPDVFEDDIPTVGGQDAQPVAGSLFEDEDAAVPDLEEDMPF
jgi:hypothetical protein